MVGRADSLPGLGFPDCAGVKGGVDVGDSLADDLAATDRIVANFGIAHDASGQANSFARGGERNNGVVFDGVAEEF